MQGGFETLGPVEHLLVMIAQRKDHSSLVGVGVLSRVVNPVHRNKEAPDTIYCFLWKERSLGYVECKILSKKTVELFLSKRNQVGDFHLNSEAHRLCSVRFPYVSHVWEWYRVARRNSHSSLNSKTGAVYVALITMPSLFAKIRSIGFNPLRHWTKIAVVPVVPVLRVHRRFFWTRSYIPRSVKPGNQLDCVKPCFLSINKTRDRSLGV
ncbi:hypothetical protein VNO77_31569 [Canavalia gladiata]|uniref:Uncharacterized protein n=1 Tax=Canavalia gladiata TaxID=3824 RepID=A0AAN9KP98_CANGL